MSGSQEKGGCGVIVPLGLSSGGEKGEIANIKGQNGCRHGSGKNLLCHAEDMGLRAGKIVEMLTNEGKGALLLKVNESRIAIGRGMAMKIMVKKQRKSGSGE